MRISLTDPLVLPGARPSGSPAILCHTRISHVTPPNRLAKRGEVAVLSFEILTATRMGRAVRIAHDVRVEILKREDVSRLEEPMCPEPQVHILLPPLAKMRSVVERMRPLAADVIGIRANLSGCLQLCAQTDAARVDVSWNGLTNPKMGKPRSGCMTPGRGADTSRLSARDPNTQDPDNSEARDPTTLYGLLVSLKSIQKFLNSHVVSTTTIACEWCLRPASACILTAASQAYVRTTASSCTSTSARWLRRAAS